MKQQPDQFQLEFVVRDYECDLQGIVNNANYQHFYEHTRHEFLIKNGVSFAALHDQGIDFVVARVELSFKRPLKSGDRFVCTMRMEHDGIKYVFYQKVLRIPNMDVCNIGKTTCVALVNGKLAPCKDLDYILEKLEP